MKGVAEHHLDLTSSAEEAGRLRAEGYRSLWTPAKPTGEEEEEPVGNVSNNQTSLDILALSGRLWGPC